VLQAAIGRTKRASAWAPFAAQIATPAGPVPSRP